MVEFLDPTHKLIKNSFFREHCTFTNGVFVKDLGNLGINLKDIFLVDVVFSFIKIMVFLYNLQKNSEFSYMLNPQNGFLIKGFFDDIKDKELKDLIPFFTFLKDVSEFFC